MYHKWRSNDPWFLRYWMRQNFLSFCAIFYPFTCLTTWTIKILKTWKKQKKSLVTSSFYTCIPQMKITQCMVHEMWSTTDWIFCHFGLFFALLPHKTQKIKILKKWKKACILHKCTKKIIICYTVPEILWVTDVTFTLGYFLHSPPPSPELFFALLACVPKIIIRCMVPEIWCAVDGRTVG